MLVLQVTRDVGDAIVLDDGPAMPLTLRCGRIVAGRVLCEGRRRLEDLGLSHLARLPPQARLTKRKHVQGPIDDALHAAVRVCVRGTGTPWSRDHHDWAEFTLQRFEQVYDKYLRANLPSSPTGSSTKNCSRTHNVILFGDPGSNSVLAKVVDELPLAWTKQSLEVRGEKFDPHTHGVPLIYPNPFNHKPLHRRELRPHIPQGGIRRLERPTLPASR